MRFSFEITNIIDITNKVPQLCFLIELYRYSFVWYGGCGIQRFVYFDCEYKNMINIYLRIFQNSIYIFRLPIFCIQIAKHV